MYRVKEGNKFRFAVGDGTESDWGNKEEFETAKQHAGQICTVTGIAIEPMSEDEFSWGYYDIQFADGVTLLAVSGFNLDTDIETNACLN